MMDIKLWIALCALLLINLGSAEHDDGHDAASSAPQSALGGKASPEAADTSSLDPIHLANPAPSLSGSDTNSSSRGNGSLSSNTTTEVETNSGTHEPKKVNDTNIVSTSEAAVPENSGNQTDRSTSQPLIPLSGSPAPTSLTPPPTTTITGPTHTTHTTSVDTPTTPRHSDLPLPASVTPSNQATPVPTPEPPKPESTTATIIAQSSSTSSTSSSQEPPMHSPTLTSPQSTSQSSGDPKTSSEAHLKNTSNLPSSPTAQASPHADTPSQLNVGGDPTMVHDSPTLDPLLAGLVSAFIITAVIITLLLFLKLRRRDNRPEFRRLQDLPMDDMMEDTPLSMYSY